MKRVYYRLQEYFRYLSRAREWMWAPHRLDKVAWEKIPRPLPPLSATSAAKAARAQDSRIWVRIEQLEESDEIDRVERFCDADWVIEEPNPKAPLIEVVYADPEEGTLLLSREPHLWKGAKILFLRPNEYVIDRQIKSIWKLQNAPDQGHLGLIRLLLDRDRALWRRPEPKTISEWKFLTKPERPGTDEQRRFVEIALDTPDFAFLEGPPGSGKTTSICELIVQEVRRGHRVLLSASTHVAVDNVLETLHDSGLTDTEVVAVRIGDARKLSDKVLPYQFEEWIRRQREELVRKLAGLRARTESQEYLLQALQSGGEEILGRLILDCANLVCGTTMGILKHPEIQASRDEAVPKYNLLIVDEASKTPFQEFLVPALFARRWILVGDIQQLSPYVETRNVEANVRALVPEEDAEVCLRVFQAWQAATEPRLSTAGFLVVGPDESTRRKYTDQVSALDLTVSDLSASARPSPPAPLDFLCNNVVLAPQVDDRWKSLLPPDLRVFPSEASPDLHVRRHAYWESHFGPDGGGPAELPEAEQWAREIAWRLNRSFELRTDLQHGTRYDRELEALLPRWYPEQRKKWMQQDLQLIKRVVLPSVLELLQSGFARPGEFRWGEDVRPQDTQTALTDGMPKAAFEERHLTLTYQHRMHPEISRFPREHFYNSQRLRDPDNMADLRHWAYTRHKPRSVWLHVSGPIAPWRQRGASTARSRIVARSNVNPDEVDAVMNELEHFLQWAASNANDSEGARKPWEVAILTFYRGQELLFRVRLQERFRERTHQRNFTTNDRRVRVTLCTVNRFQGQQADLVFVSFVHTRKVGFLDDPHQLNVAITRARYQLVLVGNQNWFSRQRKSQLLRDLAAKLPVDISLVQQQKRETGGERGGIRHRGPPFGSSGVSRRS